MTPLSFKSAVITGAASGIGRALVQRLAENNTSLHLLDVDRVGLERISESLRVESYLAADVSQAKNMQAYAEVTGAVDLVCLNAGVVTAEAGPPWEQPPEEWDRVLGTNLLGVVNGLRAFVPLLVERDRPAHILVTASVAGAATWPGGGPYGASKHAVLAVAEQAALHLADTPVSVTVLCPAQVRTGMSERGEDPLDVADRALAAVQAGDFAVVPAEWHDAIRQRASRLIAGAQPLAPRPIDQETR